MTPFEQFHNVQHGSMKSGRFTSSMDKKYCYCDSEDRNSFFMVHKWAEKKGLNWKTMTEEEFNIMKFEVKLNVDI